MNTKSPKKATAANKKKPHTKAPKKKTNVAMSKRINMESGAERKIKEDSDHEWYTMSDEGREELNEEELLSQLVKNGVNTQTKPMPKELSDEELSDEEREEKLSRLVQRFKDQSEYKRYQQLMGIAQTMTGLTKEELYRGNPCMIALTITDGCTRVHEKVAQNSRLCKKGKALTPSASMLCLRVENCKTRCIIAILCVGQTQNVIQRQVGESGSNSTY
jgi:hypothetical protein